MRRRIRVGLASFSIALAACNSAVPPTAPDAMRVEPGMSRPAGTGVTGRWAGVGHSAQGSVRVTVKSGVMRLDLSDDFSVGAVPGPFVYVNTTKNANTGRPLRVAALRSNAGAQSYAFQLPDAATYTWVLIWCDPFNVPVAEASIPPTP